MSTRIITTCTDRKRLRIAPQLHASTLPRGLMSEVASEWLSRLSGAVDRRPASSVYGGRSFQEAMAAADIAGSKLAVISAGLGLVMESQSIPAYGLTLAQGAEDEIMARCTGDFVAAEWWSLINRKHPQPINRFVRADPNGIVVIGLSSAYARLVENDLLALNEADRSRIRIVGLSISGGLPTSLRDFVLPYDSRLDGPDSNCKGTRSDFASRAIRHFVETIMPKAGSGDIRRHKAAVSDWMAGWAIPQTFERKKLSDDDIVSLIRARMSEVGRSSTRMLKHFRHVEMVACEQTRFKNLFKRAVEETKS